MMNIAEIILAHFITSEPFANLVHHHMKASYFSEVPHGKETFEVVSAYYEQYGVFPNHTALLYEIQHQNYIKPDQKEGLETFVKSLYKPENYPIESPEWLVDKARRFVREKGAFDAVMQCIEVFDGKSELNESQLADVFVQAITADFDQDLGLEWGTDAKERIEFYTKAENFVPFTLKTLQAITANKGVAHKSLNLIMAQPHAGKTAMMCNLACDYIRDGKNVLYITLEMREELIAKRIDANLLSMAMNELERVKQDEFIAMVEEKAAKYGRLIVKEYATGQGSVRDIRNLVKNLKRQKGFAPDIVLVDYMGIMASTKMRIDHANSYTYLKSISEELRAFAIDYDVVVWSAMQTKRGTNPTDVGMADVADSFAVMHTADFILALTRTKELDQDRKVLITQIKNRYDSIDKHTTFTLKVDPHRQKYFDADESILQSPEALGIASTPNFGAFEGLK